MPPIRSNQPLSDVIVISDDEDDATLVPSTTPNSIPGSPLTPCPDDNDDFPPVKQKTCSSRLSSLSPYREPSPLVSRVSRKTASKLPRPAPVTISGLVLQPTVAFDTFWRWCAERKKIEDRRRAGDSFPWTKDPILRKFFFCNTYRVLDKTTQFIIRRVVEEGSQKPNELVFRVLLFSTFTKIQTWEWLEERLGPLMWKTYVREKYVAALQERKQTGLTLYTGAFQKPGPKWEHNETWLNHLALVEVMMENRLAEKLANVGSMADAYSFIASFPGMGAFNSFQLLLNLSYTSVFNFHGNDFVVPGLGAVSGLKKLFGSSLTKAMKKNPDIQTEIIRWMTETQDEHFRSRGLEFSGLGEEKLPMQLADMEHAICEVDKYARKAHPELSGDRTQLRRNWSPSEDPYPAQPVLPKAWSHPARQLLRPCNKVPSIEQRYAVQAILEHGLDDDDAVRCKVRWFGYSSKDDTWEPIETLFEDAPVIVNAYWKKATGKVYKRR